MSSEASRRNTEWTREYLDWQRRRNRAKETLFIYTDVLNKFLAWIGDSPLTTVSTRTMEEFIDRPRLRRRPEHARGQTIIGSPATRKRDTTIVRSFFRYLTERGYIANNSASLLVAPTVHNVSPKAIDDEVWRAVWGHQSLSDTDRLVLGFGFFCGLRRREIVDLQPRHLDLDHQRLTSFPRKGGLSATFPYGSATLLIAARLPRLTPGGPDVFLGSVERETRSRELLPYLLAWGDALGDDGDSHLHGRERLDRYAEGWTPPHIINKRLRRILRRCGLPSDSFTPHALRHSFVTNLLRAGVPLHVVSRMAAHADTNTTMRYVRTTEDPLRDLLDRTIGRPNRW